MSFDIHLTIQRIKEEAEKNDTSLNQFLINNSLPQHLVDNMKRGRIPNIETIYNFAEKANCSVDYLLGLTDVEKITSEPTTIYRFPVFRQEAAAGVGRLDVSDGYSMENFTINNLPNEATFIMEIAGESMYDEKTDYLIHTGSKVFVDPQTTKYNLDEKIVIANFRGKTICKRYIVKDTYILFQSDNDAFEKENRKSTDDPDHKIIGVVLGVIENEKFVPVK